VSRGPALHVSDPLLPTRAVALLLHGGRARSSAAASPRQLAALRMRPFASSLRQGGARDGLAVARLRYAVRGWNGVDQAPAQDTIWALDELASRFPGAPVALIGHSMGGRAALFAAGYPSVASIVALAPWIEREDPVDQLAGRRLLVVHGAHDRMTSARRSAAYAQQAAAVAASVSYVRVDDEAHAMLRRAALWHRLSTGFVLATVLDRPPTEPTDDPVTKVLQEALAGQPSLVV
jgi:dienelactone hydrolase